MILRCIGRFVGAVVAVFMSLLAPAEVRASVDPLAVSLEYDASNGCPGVDDFKVIVIRRLGYDPFRTSAPDRVFVRITTRGRAVEGRVEWRDASGNWVGDRAFPSPADDCPELVRAMGFALALQIQFLAIAGAPVTSGAATARENSRPAAAPPPPPVPPPSLARRDVAGVVATTAAKSPSSGPTFAIGAGASAGFGLASSATWLGRLFGSVAWPHIALELGAEISLPTTTRRADGAGFSQQQLFVSAAGCGVLQRWSACVLAKAGQIRVAGQDIDLPASSSGPILETGIRVGVTQRLGQRAYVSAHADALVHLTRWAVILDELPVWTAPGHAGTLGLDVGMRFP